MMAHKTYNYVLDIKKRWPNCDDKDFKLLLIYLKTMIKLPCEVEGSKVYYNRKLTRYDQGRIDGYMSGIITFACFMEDDGD